MTWPNLIEPPGTLAEIAASQIREAVISGVLRPGDKLVEGQLAEQMGTSRGPVREAIRLLEKEGLVSIEPHRGAFVTKLSVKKVREIHTLRAVLEGLAVRLALENKNYQPEDIVRLQALIDKMNDLAERNDFIKVAQLDMQFHEVLCSKADHELLLESLSNLRTQTLRLIILTEVLRSDLEDEARMHQPILDALRSGDADRMEESIKQHITTAGELLVQKLSEESEEHTNAK
jgi:DNA-binding GntR family transcriptional regulator